MNLTNDNIELYLFQYKEGMLDAESAAAVEQALASHPDWREMADLYDPTLKLPAGATMPYSNWQSLRDGSPKAAKQRRLIPIWTKAIAAAACLLLFVISIEHFASNPANNSNIQLTAKADPVVIDSSSTPCDDTASVPTTPYSPVRSAVQAEPTLLAEATTIETSPNDASSTNPLPLKTSPADTIIRLPDTLSHELNDPMDQQVLYANNIDWDDIQFESPATQHEEPHNTPRRNTATTHKERREAIATAIEDRLRQNETINNIEIIDIIASIE